MKEVESESLRLLRLIVEGPTENVGPAVDAARRYLATLKRVIQPERQNEGRPHKLTYEQLRLISRLAAEGRGCSEIQRLTGIDRGNVRHHLRPSKSMLVAIVGEKGLTDPQERSGLIASAPYVHSMGKAPATAGVGREQLGYGEDKGGVG